MTTWSAWPARRRASSPPASWLARVLRGRRERTPQLEPGDVPGGSGRRRSDAPSTCERPSRRDERSPHTPQCRLHRSMLRGARLQRLRARPLPAAGRPRASKTPHPAQGRRSRQACRRLRPGRSSHHECPHQHSGRRRHQHEHQNRHQRGRSARCRPPDSSPSCARSCGATPVRDRPRAVSCHLGALATSTLYVSLSNVRSVRNGFVADVDKPAARCPVRSRQGSGASRRWQATRRRAAPRRERTTEVRGRPRLGSPP